MDNSPSRSRTASNLLKASSVYWAAASVLHAYLSHKRLDPFLDSKSDAFKAYILKNISYMASGYFVINSKNTFHREVNATGSNFDM